MAEPNPAPQIGQYVASDGYRLQYRHWVPQAMPRGYIIALHGIQSHSGWYDYSSRRMCEAGYEVWFLDRRGSGLNAEDRGHAQHPDRLVHDVTQVLEEVCWEREITAPAAPVILLGLSWGGKLAAVTAARRPKFVDGLALLYPGLRARVRPKWHQRRLLKLGMALGAERKLVRIPLEDPAQFTADPGWQDFIKNDPLALHEVTVAFLQTSVALDAEVNRIPELIRQPALVMLAGGDQIIDNPATRRYLNELGTSHLVLREYAQAQHTLEFEPRRETIFADFISWLKGVSRRTAREME